MRIYLDTAPIIYIVEQIAPYSATLDQHLMGAENVLIASDLSRLECRVKPLREGNASLLADYDQFFQDVIREPVILSTEVIDLATEIRASYGFSTPDAIHLAAASTANCDLFLTNDRRLERFVEVKVQTL